MSREMGIRFSERQLDDPIGYTAWAKTIAARTDDRADELMMAAISDTMTNTRDGKKPSVLFARQGIDFLTRMLASCTTGEIDTGDPVIWVIYEQALVYATRLMAYRDIRMPHNASLYNMLKAVCAYIAVSAMICDVNMRPRLVRELSDDIIDDRWLNARSRRVFTDVCCGRTAVWIAYCRHMGSIASSKDAYMRLREAHADFSANDFVRNAQSVFLFSDEVATGTYMLQAQAASSCVNTLAAGRWMKTVKDMLPIENINWNADTCCATFGIDELDCVCMMPQALKASMANEMRQAYTKQMVSDESVVPEQVDSIDDAAFHASLF